MHARQVPEPVTGPVADRDERAGASPTTTTAILALQRRAGNRAVGRWLNGRPARRLQRKEQTLPVDAGQSIRYDDELVGEQEVKRLWTKLRTDLRARVDPKSAAELYRVGKKNVAERSLGFARLPVAAETLDVAQAAMVWSYAELAGLEQALDVARRIPALAKRDPGAVVFGKVTTLLDFRFRAVPGDPGKKKQYEQYALPAGSSEHAETVIPDKGGVMSVVLSGSCVGMNTPFTSTGKSMDPLAETGDRARASHEYEIRARRMAWGPRTRAHVVSGLQGGVGAARDR
jgi:hypothetical protein